MFPEIHAHGKNSGPPFTHRWDVSSWISFKTDFKIFLALKFDQQLNYSIDQGLLLLTGINFNPSMEK